jgi:hypothetical protein
MARTTREQKREQAVIDIINQMFVIAGHEVTYEDIKGRKDDWFTDWTMTLAQSEEWRAWGIAYLRKNLKMNKKLAEKEMAWFNVQWGGNGFHLSNWQFKHEIHDIEWEADANEWGGVIAMINSGTSIVSEVKSR